MRPSSSSKPSLNSSPARAAPADVSSPNTRNSAIRLTSNPPPSCPADCSDSQAEVAQARMVVGTAAERPVEFPLPLGDGQVVDAGEAAAHQAVGIELPVLVAVAAEPAPGIVAAPVRETH